MVQKMKYMMAACFLMVATTCMAMLQQKPGDGEQPRDGKRPRPNMEQFVKSQATRIAQSLNLDGETSKKFIQTFYNCRKEMAATMKGHPHKKRSEMTDAEVDKAIVADFKQGRKMLDIREKYYAAYSRFLTPKQIQRVYDLERRYAAFCQALASEKKWKGRTVRQIMRSAQCIYRSSPKWAKASCTRCFCLF